MATANLQGLTHRDDISLAWSRFLIDDLVEHRESGTRPILAGVYSFELDEDGTPSLPTVPEYIDLNDLKSVKLPSNSFAYLAVITGIPMTKVESDGLTKEQSSVVPIGIPRELIEDGIFDWYLMAVFISDTKEMTFCGAFTGREFTTINCCYGSYGGILGSLLRHLEN